MKKYIVCIVVLILSFTVYAGKFSMADDILDVFRKSFKFSGKISKEVIESGIAKYGDDFIVFSKKYGPEVVSITQKYGDEGFDIIKKYGDEGIKAVNNYGNESFKLISKYGDNIIPVISRHNNINLGILENYGDDIIRINKKLPREKVISIIEATNLDNTGKYTENMIRNGDKIIKFIEEHPKFFIGVPLTMAIYQVITNEELNKKAIEEVGDVSKSLITTSKDTIVELAGGKNNIASIIRAMILSIGFLIVIYSVFIKRFKIKLFEKKRYRKTKKDENINKEGWSDNSEK